MNISDLLWNRQIVYNLSKYHSHTACYETLQQYQAALKKAIENKFGPQERIGGQQQFTLEEIITIILTTPPLKP